MVKQTDSGYMCDKCRSTYPTPEEASQCEHVHQVMVAYSRGEADELAVAEAMGFDLSTEKAQLSAIQSVRNMLLSGASPTLDRTKAYTMGARATTFHGVTTLHGDGRTQVPRNVRDALKLKDGDYVFWYEVSGMFVISPQEMNADWMKGHATYIASKAQARPR